MAKKFIRHLEFYGFPDQNSYIGFCNGVDLTDIREKNKEQDEEIDDLEGEKADKKDLDELSGTVESIITLQTEINQEFAEAISGNTERINTIADKVDEISDAVNDALCGIQNLGDRLDDVAEDLAELSGKVEDFSANTEAAISGINETLDTKLDKEEAEETYAKKEDVYTKEETDAKIAEELEPYATKQWIEESGYITQEQGDERYAKKETVDALSDRIDAVQLDLSTKIYDLSGDVLSFSSTTNARIGTLETNFETLRGEVDRKINNLSAVVETYDERISQNAADIDALEDEMARKANQSDLEVLQNTVSNLSDLVDTKVSKVEFETYKSLVANQMNDLDDRKADKTALADTNERVDALEDALNQEKEDRASGDTYILNIISGINTTIEEILEDGEGYDERITELEDGLAEEIRNRIQGDIDLIGTEDDDKDDDTIWGAKKYAQNQRAQAVLDAKDYTDQEVSNLRNDMNAQFNEVERELSGKASKDYVDASRNELKAELQEEFNDAIDAERERAEGEETSLLVRILANTSAITENNDAIDLLANRVNAITAWDGTDPDEYVNTGNGVLDVLHREFHALIDTLTQKGILP